MVKEAHVIDFRTSDLVCQVFLTVRDLCIVLTQKPGMRYMLQSTIPFHVHIVYQGGRPHVDLMAEGFYSVISGHEGLYTQSN